MLVYSKRLCDWAQQWLKAWNRLDEIAYITIDPLLRLREIFDEIPANWSEDQQLEVAFLLDSYEGDNVVPRLLTHITEQSIWLEEPSIDNLASWLTIDIPPEWQPLEKVWQNRLSSHELGSYYQTADKVKLLRKWLGMEASAPKGLPPYPLPIPENLQEEFDCYWEKELYKTQGGILSNLIPDEVTGFDRIARIACKVFQNRPQWLNKSLLQKITPYLNSKNRKALNKIIPPEVPPLLISNATAEDALKWATESY